MLTFFKLPQLALIKISAISASFGGKMKTNSCTPGLSKNCIIPF
ncbi:hypothetical protein PtrM4_113620 [Pyrenophora tritici-repentis]|uniref:Uncharacterized protein n=1 Tax=Pyrenophora tritici-repentis TaxID=45151 RepID=A0A834RSR3_9PLEO|nr:hypothetical protein PtrM4_113620 [Pyrenophora tritici-repentis]KAI0577333.1 hypothetical protein Alg215_06978 [Pyrenophora tritici-repentis]